MPVKPETLEETVTALWYAIVGTNGDGVQTRLKKLEDRPRSRWLMIKDVILVTVPAVMLARVLGFI